MPAEAAGIQLEIYDREVVSSDRDPPPAALWAQVVRRSGSTHKASRLQNIFNCRS